MGFHWKPLRYPSVDAFVDSLSTSGNDGQMDAFARFVDRKDRLQFALKIGDWDTLELLYNGGGYGGYAAKLRDAVALYADPRNAMPAPRLLRGVTAASTSSCRARRSGSRPPTTTSTPTLTWRSACSRPAMASPSTASSAR